MIRQSQTLLKKYAVYHRRAMGTMSYTRWSGRYGGVSRWYNRTGMTEAVKPNEPISLIDRRMMAYVHTTKVRHHQLFRSYQEKQRSTESKLREGAMLRRRWHRRLQKSFITFMQFKMKTMLEEQAALVSTFGQAAVNRALGDPAMEKPESTQKRWDGIRRKVKALPPIMTAPKHVATMKQIHNDRFDFRWRQN